MKQLFAIASSTYLQAVRQPAYGIIVFVTLGGLALSPFLTGWTLDDDNKMLRDIGLSTLLIQGLFLACFVASSVLDAEIEDKTALTVAAKPIRRTSFVLGKYLGVMGALITAHYLAGIIFFMTMRHGVLQSSAETSDVTVLIFGPGVMLLMVIVATVMNYVFERRFLPTLITLAVPAMTLSTLILLAIDRDFNVHAYKTTQTINALPREVVDETVFKGIIEFQPDKGNDQIEGHSGKLVRSMWKGPITDADREYLLGLVDDVQWRRDIKYLVDATRKQEGFEVTKAALLILGAVALLASFAVAASTRLGLLSTFVISFLVICAGLISDQVIKPIADNGHTWASFLYRVIPNIQCFWMVDALNEHRSIPIDYLATTGGYALGYVIAMLLLAMALFETREVG
ncbi:MAG: hypothetical protein MI923_18650 [Phycisphaerales bacterium]|nr:hypothetical protein [Phycisphaerales bacterium]